MALSLYDIRRILNPKREQSVGANVKIIDTWAEYKDGKNTNERPLDYLMYEMETIDPETGDTFHFYKALKFARVIRLPKGAKQSTALMDMHAQVLAAVYEESYNFITVIANIREPVALGLLFLYGVQGVAQSVDEAKAKAHEAFLGLTSVMQGTYRVLEMRIINAQETEWLREKLYNMKYSAVVRGIPKASKTGEDAGNKGMGGKNLNPDSQGTLEEIITGLADYEYVIEVLTSPVRQSTLRDWASSTERDMTSWQEQMQGTKGFNMSLSIPMMYAANQGTSQGSNRGYTEAESQSFSQGTSSNISYGENVGQALSQSYGQSFGKAYGQSFSESISSTHTISQGQSFGQSVSVSIGQSQGQSFGQNVGESYGQNIGQSTNMSQGQSFGESRGISQGQSFGQNIGQSQSTSQSSSMGQSINQSQGISSGQSLGQSFSQSASKSNGLSVGQSFSESLSQGRSTGVSQSFGQSVGESFGRSNSIGQNLGVSQNQSFSTSRNESYGQSAGMSYGQSSGGSYSVSNGSNQSASHGIGASTNENLGTSTGVSQSAGSSYGTSHSMGSSASNGWSQSENAGLSKSQGANVSGGFSANASAGVSGGASGGTTFTDSHTDTSTWSGNAKIISHSDASADGTSVGANSGWNSGANASASGGYTSSGGISESAGATYSYGEGLSGSLGKSESLGTSGSQSASLGINQGASYSTGHGTSENYSESFGKSISESYGVNQSTSNSASVSNSHSVGEGMSYSMGQGSSNGMSRSTGETYGQNMGQSYSEGMNSGVSQSMGQSAGQSMSQSLSQSFGESLGQSMSQSMSNSMSQGYGQSASQSMGQSIGQTYGQSVGQNVGNSYSQNVGQSTSQGSGTSLGESMGISKGYSVSSNVGTSSSRSTGQTYTVSQSESWSTSHGFTKGESYTESTSESSSTGTTQSYGQSKSVGQGTSTSKGTGTSQSQTMGYSTGLSQGFSSSMGISPSLGYSKSYQWIDQQVKDIVEMLEYQNERLKNALRGNGAFYSYVYIACPSLDALSSAKALAKSTWQNEEAMVNPLQVLNLNEAEQENILIHSMSFSADVTMENVGGLREYKYCSVLLPKELVSYTHLPRVSEGGLFVEVGDIPKFSVPSMLKGEIYMGTILSAERYTMQHGYETPFQYRIDERELMHMFVTGASRSGKTVAAMRFVAELTRVRRKSTGKRLRIVCMDPKQDWRALAKYVEPERFRFYNMGNTLFRPIHLNPLKIPHGVNPQFWIDGVIDIYCRSYGLLERGKQMLGETIYQLYHEAGVFGYTAEQKKTLVAKYKSEYLMEHLIPSTDEEGNLAAEKYARDRFEKENADIKKNKRPDLISAMSSTVTFAKVYDRMNLIKLSMEGDSEAEEKYFRLTGQKSKGKSGNDTKDAYARLLDRLQAFNREFSVERQLFGTEKGISVDELIGADDVTIIESKGLESTFRNFIFGVITSGFYKFALAHEGGFLADDQYETVLVIEEANEVLTGSDVAGTGGGASFGMTGQSEFEQILDQSAGYGLFIMAITQKISDMPSSIIANSGLVFAGRLKRPEDVTAVVRAIAREDKFEDRDLVKWFPRSPTGYFICMSSRTFDYKDAEPILVKISPLNLKAPSNAEIDELLEIKEADALVR